MVGKATATRSKRIALALSSALMCLALAGCAASGETGGGNAGSTDSTAATQDEIVVLFTNDVHGAIGNDFGYAGVAAYRDRMLEKTDYVTLVDCGDAIQGDVLASLSKGQIVIDLMNEVGYDLAVLGNHEFDYGMAHLGALISDSTADYLCCNISYSGDGINALTAVEPYRIIEYGDVSVAYIGVTTPEAPTSSMPSNFMEDGERVFSFSGGNEGADLYACVQRYVDECLEAGADHVIALTHLGDLEESSPYSSIDLIENTEGIDAVLDGHSHSVIPCQIEENVRGEEVLLASTGTKLDNIGQLIISPEGNISVGLISGYGKKDSDVELAAERESAEYQAILGETIGTSDVALSMSDADGARMTRVRETTIGNFCADAYRVVSGSQIAFVNGGGLRAGLPAGKIIFADILSVYPYGNTLCMVEATGQEVLDALETASASTQGKASADGAAIGESGAFLSMSGLIYTIDTSIPSSVVFDEDGGFAGVEGDRRVKDVMVLGESGEYEPIDPEKTYTVSSNNFLIKQGGDGINMFVDNALLIDEGMFDYQALITYLVDHLHGDMGDRYAKTEGRITVQ